MARRTRKRKNDSALGDAQENDAQLNLNNSSRRGFLKGGGIILAGGAFAGANAGVAQAAHAFGSDEIKVGLIGCGSRGIEATIDLLDTAGGEMRLVAIADAFDSRLQSAYRSIKSRHPDKIDARLSKSTGLEAFHGVLASDADVVVLATPPGFRPQHFEAAVDADKNVFLEMPLATDAPGIRRLLAANELAKQKNLAVAVGLQRRHDVGYQECLARLRDGAIGDLVFARVYCNGNGYQTLPRKPKQTLLEYQLSNWQKINWLSGDQITERLVHNLDIVNWLVNDHPIEAQGQGGRVSLDTIEGGQTFDHHMVEFAYRSGPRMLSQCRQINGCSNQVGEYVHGTKGSADIAGSIIYDSSGAVVWKRETKRVRDREMRTKTPQDFVETLRAGDASNELEEGATSTMTAIMGRMATYSGRIIRWDDAFESSVSLADTDSLKSLQDQAPLQPNASGNYPVAKPGNHSA